MQGKNVSFNLLYIHQFLDKILTGQYLKTLWYLKTPLGK